MNKKKVFLTVLLSALLALLIAFCIIECAKKPKTIEKMSQQEKVQTSVQVDEIKEDVVKNNDEVKVIQKVLPVEKKTETTTKFSIKETQNKLQNNESKKVENASNILEERIEEQTPIQDDGVIVPVNYVSKNTYKYTYTPKRYQKRK